MVKKTMKEEEFDLSKKRERFFNEMSNHTPELAWAFQFVESEIKRQDKEFIKRQIDRMNERIAFFDDLRGLKEVELQRAEVIKIRNDLLIDAGEKLK